jgi:hypothetical protein
MNSQTSLCGDIARFLTPASLHNKRDGDDSGRLSFKDNDITASSFNFTLSGTVGAEVSRVL